MIPGPRKKSRSANSRSITVFFLSIPCRTFSRDSLGLPQKPRTAVKFEMNTWRVELSRQAEEKKGANWFAGNERFERGEEERVDLGEDGDWMGGVWLGISVCIRTNAYHSLKQGRLVRMRIISSRTM